MLGQAGIRVAFLLALGLMIAASHGWGSSTTLPELPEGDGIAAGYPGDQGIEEDTAVVFADGFEGIEDATMAPGFQKQKGKKWDSTWHTIGITENPENVHSGRRAVEITHEQPMAHGADRHFKEGFDTLHVRYYMKYAKDYPGCHHTGMHIMGGAPGVTGADTAGVRPDGRNHFVVKIDTLPPWTHWSDRPPGVMDIYCYHMDQGKEWGDLFFPSGEVYPPENKGIFGEQFVARPDLSAELDRWYCYELMVKVNTPGERDGRVAFWVDGKLAGDFPNLRLRSVPELKANHVVLSSYSSRRHPNKTLWYDDVVVATSYIGPRVPIDSELEED